MKTSDFDYCLPEHLIAQSPSPVRDRCRLLVLDRKSGNIEDKTFCDIVAYLRSGDLLIANRTRVMPARLQGRKRSGGAECEILLLRQEPGHEGAFWQALVRPGKRLRPGAIVDVENGSSHMAVEILDWTGEKARGMRFVKLEADRQSIPDAIHELGQLPYPPYIKNYTGNPEMYQTVYSKNEGSAAAPTAGLHFTETLIDRIRKMGIGWSYIDLEVGIDTFRSVGEEDARDHQMHTERYSIPPETVEALRNCKRSGGRIIAVGTTSVRALESSAKDLSTEEMTSSPLSEGIEHRATSLYILPGYEFKVVDALITNFHAPRTTLLMLVSAFASRDAIMAAYEHAKEMSYRFLSFGDAMFIY